MEMQGQRRLPLPQAIVWAALNDPEMLKVCVPGCEKFEVEGEGTYTVVTALKIGPVSARFTGKVKLSDVQAPQSYTLGFEGQGGVAGFGKGTSAVRLEPVEGGCDLHYTVNATVGGKIAQLGQRLIDGVARSLADDFFKRFEAELLRRNPPPAEAEAIAAEPAPVPSSDGGPAGGAADASSSAPGQSIDTAAGSAPGQSIDTAAGSAPAQPVGAATGSALPHSAPVPPAPSRASDETSQAPSGSSSARFWIAGAVAAAIVIWLIVR
jgi:hypothetical protein